MKKKESELPGNFEIAFGLIEEYNTQMSRRLIGQTAMIDGLLIGIIAGGHILIEGVPGLAKTMAVQTLSDIMDLDFKRIQFTPDLLPADLTGTMVYRHQSGKFVARKGPVFSNVILADEINRAPAKVQSALLEAMSEKQVTIGRNTYPLPDPFFVLATQNPIEQEGTYPLPEAQLDRFMLKLKVDYASPEEELEILRRMGNNREIEVDKVFTPEKIRQLREIVYEIKIEERVQQYIVDLITATRSKDRFLFPFSKYIDFGASTRGSLSLLHCSKVAAIFKGRDYVTPEDVKAVVYDVLRHRIVLSYEAESREFTQDDIIDRILQSVDVP